MTVVQTVDFDFGKVSLQRNNRSKYMRLKVHPEKGIIVSIPRGISENQAIDFVKRKQDWIKKSLVKTQKVANRVTGFEENTVFKTRYHELKILKHNRQTLKFDVRGNQLLVYYPQDIDIKHNKVQAFIRHALVETMRYEAKIYLPSRVEEIAAKLQLDVGNISVRNNKSRWGSCSGKNNISLNIHLMRLPDELTDYIIYHELAHIRVKSHGKPFWQYLELILPGARRLDKKLNKYHLVYW